MIVDDAALMRTVIRNVLLDDPGFQVVASVENGAKALEELKNQPIDIVICDIEMPVMDGLTFIRHARLKTRAKIVVLSSVAGMGSQQATEARRLGADAVIQKPSGSVSLDLGQKMGKQVLDILHKVAG
ncbi:MAG TPA: response regulator [Polyangiaceae bacterium]|nr:response regulator [Polyangiaceae bacterium]